MFLSFLRGVWFFLKLLFCDLDLTAGNGRRKQKNPYLRPKKQFL